MLVGSQLDRSLVAPWRRRKAHGSRRLLLGCLALLMAASGTSVVAQQADRAVTNSNLHRSQAAVDALQKWYDPPAGSTGPPDGGIPRTRLPLWRTIAA